MTFVYIAFGISCLFSLINLIAIIFLSNSLFRILIKNSTTLENIDEPKNTAGLVDPRPTATYDPRFRS